MKHKFEHIKASKLVKALWNYKNDDAQKMRKLVENIRQNGQVENIIVRDIGNGKYEVVNGNHRLDAFQELELDEVMVCNLGKVSDAQAKKIAVETNETRFPSDLLSLSTVMKDILIEFPQEELLTSMPYTDVELNDLLNLNKNPILPPEVNDAEGDEPAFLNLKIALTQEQHEAWNQWKNTIESENDAEALLKAIQFALILIDNNMKDKNL
jgi:ParB-like chromosome segregation protein Spo0J